MSRNPLARVLVLFAVIMTAFLVMQLSATGSGAAGSSITVIYKGPNEDVEVNGTNLKYRIREEQFDHPASTMPTKVVTVTKETAASSVEVDKLVAFIRSTKFFQLKSEYGVKAAERHYPYEIRINDGGQDKKVIYRSGGDDSQRPEDFGKIESRLLDFARKETTVKH